MQLQREKDADFAAQRESSNGSKYLPQAREHPEIRNQMLKLPETLSTKPYKKNANYSRLILHT
jgi:hypothetical protein